MKLILGLGQAVVTTIPPKDVPPPPSNWKKFLDMMNKLRTLDFMREKIQDVQENWQDWINTIKDLINSLLSFSTKRVQKNQERKRLKIMHTRPPIYELEPRSSIPRPFLSDFRGIGAVIST